MCPSMMKGTNDVLALQVWVNASVDSCWKKQWLEES